MSSKRNKPTVENGRTGTRTYDVQRTGTRNSVRVTESAASRAAPSQPILLAENQMTSAQVNNLVSAEFGADDSSAFGPVSGVESEMDVEYLRAELEGEIEDAADTYVGRTMAGEGQNEMLRDWKDHWGQLFLSELYGHYAAPESRPCMCASPKGPRYRCDDCVTSVRFCSTCILQAHQGCPTHRISLWDGHTWARTSLKSLGVVIKAGLHLGHCIRTPPKPLLLGDVSGFHEVAVTYCGCGVDECLQLLRTAIMPCSTKTPHSAFTFRALRLFDFLAYDAKLSCSRFHAVLQRQSNNIAPDLHRSRLRELLRVTREWTYLQTIKRSGQVSADSSQPGSLSVRCPACPQLGKNHLLSDIAADQRFLYAQLLSYDGSFQLVRRNKAIDQFDICLTDGKLYMVGLEAYQAHLLANMDTAYGQSKRGECNNHRAANDTWVQQSGVVETGLGAVTCAWHTVFMPQGCVSYWKGERYAYTDFGVGSVIQFLMQEQASEIGVFYDIFCQWGKNFWSRAPKILLPSGTLIRPDRFFGGVPKYHLAAHTDDCYAQYSLNNMTGVGRLDAEGCKRAWANLNGASGSTSEKGPGARTDSLNYCMNDWNWRKMVTMVSFLLRKWREAVIMAAEQHEAWLIVHESVDQQVTAQWETCSTEPQLKDGKWTSVFLLDDSSAPSRVRTVLDLNVIESQRVSSSDTSEPGFTAPTWVSEGIDIERAQARLQSDIKAFGSSPTAKQGLETYTRRTAMAARIKLHRDHSSHFVDVSIPDVSILENLAEETDGQSEYAVLYLPSQLGDRLSPTERSQRVADLERRLRMVECLETLRQLRTACSQKALRLAGKKKNARGEVTNTRAQSAITRLSHRITHAFDDYNRSFAALKTLGLSSEQVLPLKPLLKKDLDGLMTLLLADRSVGEGRRKLPWFWSVHNDSQRTGAAISEDVELVKRRNDEEFTAAIRVEWFRGRERYRRWQEEEKWLRREMASTLFFYHTRSKEWEELGTSDYAQRTPGYYAYCLRQSDMYFGLMRDGLQSCNTALMASTPLNICTRAINELSKLT